MTKQELFAEVSDIKVASEALERTLKMEYLMWDDKIRQAAADHPNVAEWRQKAQEARLRRVKEPNAMVEALCRLIQRELTLPPGEVERRNNYATNGNLQGERWARYMVLGCR